MKPTLFSLATLTLASLLLAGCETFSSDHKKKPHHKPSHESAQSTPKGTPQESPEDFRAVKQPGT
jgi:hypothetical protein